MPWHMLHFSDLQLKSVPEQLFLFADANIESADTLCANLCADTDRATYAHGAVIQSLAFHSLELFLKGAILLKVPTEQFCGRSGHDLDQLAQRYANLYPGNDFSFDIPFRQLPDTHGMDPRIAQEIVTYAREQNQKTPVDQLHRYPINQQGKSWNTVLGFEPNSFHCTIQKLKCEFARIKSRLQNS